MRLTFLFTSLLPFAALFILFSCDSDVTITGGSSTTTVEGKVSDLNGFPAYPSRVWLNYEAYTVVSADGTFSFKDVQTPYSLTVNRHGSTEFTVYQGLTTYRPKVFINPGAMAFQNQVCLVVTLPKPHNNGKNSVTFLSEKNLYLNYQYSGSDTMVICYLHWGGNNNMLSGRLAAIQFERDQQFNISSFSGFGLKDITISAGETIYLKMTAGDFQFNPPESRVNVFFSQGSYQNGVYLQIAFDNYNKNSNINLGGTSGPNIPVSYTVPLKLPLGFRIQAHISYQGGYSDMLMNPGSTIHIQPVQPINLISPALNDTVDYNTDFVHDGSSDVYMTYFSPAIQPSNFSFLVYSSSLSVRLPVLEYFGINPPPHLPIGWDVSGYNGFNGINDFASDKRLTIYKSDVVKSSGSRQFYLKYSN